MSSIQASHVNGSRRYQFGLVLGASSGAALAQAQKPNIVLIASDDFGYGDAGVFGGGPGRGMPTPNLDRLSAEGMTFFSFYGQPSCTPGRAAMQTGRFPNRSGMTTVAFQGQGGGLPAAEWTLASVLKTVGYKTYFTGKWHLGESDYALPNAHGYDVMKYCFLCHLNSTPTPMPTRNGFRPCRTHCARDVCQGDQGRAVGNAGETAHQDWAVNGEYVDTPDKGVVGIPYLDAYVEKAAMWADPQERYDIFMNNFTEFHLDGPGHRARAGEGDEELRPVSSAQVAE